MIDRTKKNVYFIMGSQNVTGDPLNVLEQSISAGIDLFQYREKEGSTKTEIEKFALGMKLRMLCKVSHIPFIVNDDVDLAVELEADAVHLGQGDQAIKEARAILSDDCQIGISTSTVEEAIQAERDGANYIGVGPIFETMSKIDAKQPIGVERLKEIREVVSIPIVAIGGITTENVKEVYESGADAAAVISAITKAKDIGEAVGQLRG